MMLRLTKNFLNMIDNDAIFNDLRLPAGENLAIERTWILLKPKTRKGKFDCIQVTGRTLLET